MSVFQVNHPHVALMVSDLFRDYYSKLPTDCHNNAVYQFCKTYIYIDNKKICSVPTALVEIHFKKHQRAYVCIYLDCSKTHFDLILNYIYTGVLEIPLDQLIEFNDCVAELGIELLMQEIADKITFGSGKEMLDTFDKAINLNNTFMIETCTKKFIESCSCQEIYQTIPIEKISNLIIKFTPEILDRVLAGIKGTYPDSNLDAFIMLDAWSKSVSKTNLDNLKKHIRFDLLKPKDLIQIVKPSGILTDQEYMAIMEAKLMNSQICRQIYLCNVRNAIPEGYRIVTDEEFSTNEFHQELMWNYMNGFECIDDLVIDNKYLVTASRKTVMINGKKCDGNIILGQFKKDSLSVKLPSKEIPLSSHDAAQSHEDAYMCVKI